MKQKKPLLPKLTFVIQAILTGSRCIVCRQDQAVQPLFLRKCGSDGIFPADEGERGIIRECGCIDGFYIIRDVYQNQILAFGECTGIIETLDNVQYVDDWAVGFEYNYGTLEAYLRSGTIGIASSAFIGADNLVFVNVPNTVKYISSQAFEGCKYLERVVFEENSGLTRIGQLAFSGCSLLNEFDIPDSVTFVGSGAFEDCDLLVEYDGEIRYVDNWVISCNSEATAAIWLKELD